MQKKYSLPRTGPIPRHALGIDRDHFLSKVKKTDSCWLWSAGTVQGYGAFWDGKMMARANRVSYSLFVGPVEGEFALHKCNNRLCVNPAHLYLGDHAQNMKDMASSGVKKGEKNQRAVLKENQVRLIRESNEKQIAMARAFGVSPQAVNSIKKGRTWSWLR
jgi:hypothetical protein